LTPQQEIELAGKNQKRRSEARERMINSNYGRLSHRARTTPIRSAACLTLISEGNIGLTKAVERFEPHEGREAQYICDVVDQAID